MKNLVKLTLTFVLGIIVTTTVIVPKFSVTPAPAEALSTPEIQAEIKEAAVTEPILLAAAKAEPAEVQTTKEPETFKVEEIPEPEEPLQEAEPEPTPTPKPTAEPVKTATSSPPQVKKAEPEYFYEDGKKYAYINGIKSHITDEPDSVQIDFYDWENDPAGQIRGPFN